ncbi:MAG TPA: hypothetical protein VNT79_02885 [Phycisphaerae bacterium]|nr:hypothetical protein [Phycisphaerae bacterium]
MSTASNSGIGEAASWEKLPHDEMVRYSRSLGLDVEDGQTSDELIALISRRRMLLAELDREALLDVIKWSRRPVRENASKEDLAREIARIEKTNYDSLSTRGLLTLARLRDLDVSETDTSDKIIDKLHRRAGFWERVHRRRRKIVGGWLSKIIEGDAETEEAEAYQFLPADSVGEKDATRPSPARDSARQSLRRQIEEMGVVGGIAHRIRGAADDYIKVKLDEIETRIDDKLNEIDQRLGEWRDREVANRLKILRITLGFTVLVALLSLGYNYINRHADRSADTTPNSTQVELKQTN